MPITGDVSDKKTFFFHDILTQLSCIRTSYYGNWQFIQRIWQSTRHDQVSCIDAIRPALRDGIRLLYMRAARGESHHYK